MKYPILLSETVLTVLIDGRTYQTRRSNPHWEQIVEAVNDPNVEADHLISLISPIGAVATATAGNEHLAIRDGQLWYDGNPVHTALGNKVVEVIREGFAVDAWLEFAKNVYENPFRQAREELYTFLEKAELPITEDGCFIAYKKVTADYKDCHTQTFDNSVGQVLEMPRAEVDDNRDNHCSRGFHFCSKEYLRHFRGAHVMLVKINPRDVVSIPTDYDFAKGRTCRYEVIGEIEETRVADHKWDAVYVDVEVTLAEDDSAEDSKEAKKKGNNKVKNTTKKSKRAIAINTERLGRLTLKDFKKGVRDHDGSMAQWARDLGVPTSTVRNWYADLRAAKARRDALAGI